MAKDNVENTLGENIVVLFWSGVVKPMTAAADGLSKWLFASFCILVIASAFISFGVVQIIKIPNLVEQYYWALMYGGWMLLVLSSIGPMLSIIRSTHEWPLGLVVSIAVFHLLAFLFISIFVLLKESSGPSGVTAILAAAAGASMAGVGWAVQYHSSSKASRRAHTFNVLMQSRLSKEFNEHVRVRSELFPAGTVISKDVIKYKKRVDYEAAVDQIKVDFTKKISAVAEYDVAELQKQRDDEIARITELHTGLNSIKYLLNFYEFLCVGMKRGDLDEDLLIETLGDIAVSLYDDTVHYRDDVRSRQKNGFICFHGRVGKKWRPRLIPDNE